MLPWSYRGIGSPPATSRRITKVNRRGQLHVPGRAGSDSDDLAQPLKLLPLTTLCALHPKPAAEPRSRAAAPRDRITVKRRRPELPPVKPRMRRSIRFAERMPFARPFSCRNWGRRRRTPEVADFVVILRVPIRGTPQPILIRREGQCAGAAGVKFCYRCVNDVMAYLNRQFCRAGRRHTAQGYGRKAN